MLDPVYNGENISKQANNNYSELDVPEINDAMAAAKLLTRSEGARRGVGRRRPA